jgi:hypothetical protein
MNTYHLIGEKMKTKQIDYVHFAIQSICGLLTMKFLTTALHEFGHCLGGWLAGLRPIGFYTSVLWGGMSYIEGDVMIN